jgi:hypothetical protein
MTRKSPETLLAICNTIAGGIMAYSKACAINGVPQSTFWDWIKASQGGDETLMIDYLGETLPFHKAVNGARRMALHEMRGRFEEKNVLGWDEPIFYMGMPTWKPDPRVIGIADEDIREMLTGYRDGLLRDANGACIQNTIHHNPPVAAVLRSLEMAFPGEYRPGTTSQVSIASNVAIGVNFPKPRDYSGKPPAIPPAPALPQLQILPETDELQIPETEDDDELRAMLGEDEPAEVTDTPPETYAEFVPEQPKQAEPEPVMIAEPTPEKYQPGANPLIQPRNGRPLSDLERDLLARLPGKLSRPA